MQGPGLFPALAACLSEVPLVQKLVSTSMNGHCFPHPHWSGRRAEGRLRWLAVDVEAGRATDSPVVRDTAIRLDAEVIRDRQANS